MILYHVHFLDQGLKLLAKTAIESEASEGALAKARRAFNDMQDLAAFELWRDGKRLHVETRMAQLDKAG